MSSTQNKYDTWHRILATGQDAPSPHNVQPWKVRLESDSTATIFIDDARTLPKEDTTGSFILSGMSMYVELLRLAAEHEAMRLTYELLPRNSGQGLTPYARLTLTPDSTIQPRYEQAMFSKRQTSRLPQLTTPVAEAAQQALDKTAKHYGHAYGHTNVAKDVEYALRENIQALFHDLNQSSYHDEIVSWFRFSRRQSRASRDGLDFICMHVNPFSYWLSARAPWLLRIPLLRNYFRINYRRTLGATHTLGWVTGKFWEPKEAILAGEFLMNFWLQLTEHGLYIHPFGNLVTNLPARKHIEAHFGLSDLWFIFRIGYTPKPPKSYRRDLKEVLLDD